MGKPRKLFKASVLTDTTLRRLRSTPSYFFLTWRWCMWLYALIVVLWFHGGYYNAAPPKLLNPSPLTYQQMGALLLAITFLQTLVITLYAPVFQVFRPRFFHHKSSPAHRQQKRRNRRALAKEEEADVLPLLARTRNPYRDIAIYTIDVIICGLVMYYSAPFTNPPVAVGSPFYRYGMSAAFAPALVYRYRGGLLAALGYDLFAVFSMLIPPPGANIHYPLTIIDVVGSLIDAPIAALLAAFVATLLGRYAHSKKHEQDMRRRQKALVRVGESLMKGASNPQEFLQRSVAQIRQGGHFDRLTIALIEHASMEDEAGIHQPEIDICVEAAVFTPGEKLADKHKELIEQVLQSQEKLLLFEPLKSSEDIGYGIARYYLPLHRDGQVQLVLGAESKRTTPFGEMQASFLAIVGTQILVELDNIRLMEQMTQLAATAERGRIARDIHDGIAQLIYMLRLNAETCEAQAYRIADTSSEEAELVTPLALRLGKLVTLSKQALWETRNYMFSLKPMMTGSATLTQMVTNQLHEFEAISDLPTCLSVDGVEALFPDDQRQAQQHARIGAALFRIIQEALTNTYKHAAATQIEVFLHFQPMSITAEISDDGKGLPGSGNAFSSSEERIYSGHGISGMQERAQELGGTLEVLARPTGGVTVRACMPV